MIDMMGDKPRLPGRLSIASRRPLLMYVKVNVKDCLNYF